MTQRPALLITPRHLGPLSAFLESNYDVYRLWEGPPTEAAPDIRVVITAGEYPLGRELLEKLPNLSLVACFTAGFEGIDLDWCSANNIPVTHAPNVNHEDVADHAMGLIIGSRRNIVSGDRLMRKGEWTPELRLLTPSLRHQKLGIVGLGAIGQAIARRADAFGMEVSWWGPNAKDVKWPRAESLLELANRSDILVVASRADDNNRHMINADVMKAIGPHGLLVNVSRGQLIDETALIASLTNGSLGAAALDVFEVEPTPSEQWADVPNLVLTPHTGEATSEAVQGMLMLLIQNLSAHFAGEALITPV